MRRFSLIPVLLLLLGAGVNGYAGLFDRGPPPPIQLTPQTDPAAAFAQLIDDGATLRHVSKPYTGPSPRVGLATVRVNFVTDASDTATVKEFMGKSTASMTSTMKLEGVSEETMVGITDQFAADLRAALAAQGYEVLPQAELLARADYRSAVADTTRVSHTRLGSVTSVYAADTGSIRSFSMRNLAFDMKLPLLIVDVTLNFAAFDKDTNRWGVGDTITAEVTSHVVSSISGNVEVKTEDGGGSLFEFVRPLNLPSGIAASMIEQPKSAGSMAAGVLGGLLGGDTSAMSDSTYVVTAAPNYRQAVSQDLKLLASVLVNSLQKR